MTEGMKERAVVYGGRNEGPKRERKEHAKVEESK